jgi:hypothetical protein
VNLALNNHAVSTVVAVDKQRQKAGEEEEEAVHDAKRKRSLEHGALAVDIPAIAVAGDGEEAEVSAVRAVGRPVGAVGVCDSTERVDSTDESADEQQIDKGNKVGRVPRTRIQEQGAQRPGRAEHRDDEEHEDGARREEVALVVPAHEPRKHAERGDQCDDLHDPPEDEGDAGDGHGGGGTLSGLVVVSGLWWRERERICAGVVQQRKMVQQRKRVEQQEKGGGAGGRSF